MMSGRPIYEDYDHPDYERALGMRQRSRSAGLLSHFDVARR